MPVAVFLFVLGAVAALVGDHSHIVTGTTEYLSDAVPLVWSSPIWFPILVGAATVSVAELRLHLPAPRTSVTARHGLAGVAAVIGIYVITALMHTAEHSDAPFGVAPWLPALYFAFGVVTALLAEIATSSVDSAPKATLRE